VEHLGRAALQVVARDVTEPLRLHEELGRVNRALRLLGATNEALVRAESEAALLGEVCRIAVEVGGFRLAWVGLAEPDAESRLRVVARHGPDDGYLDEARIRWADLQGGPEPEGGSARVGQAVAVNDLWQDGRETPWLVGARQRGFRGFAALPLCAGGEQRGILGLLAAEAHAFDAEVLSLLQKLADDLGFGLAALRTRALLAGLLDHAPTPIFVTGVDGRLLLVNRAWEETTGFPRAQVLGRPPETFAAADALQVLRDTIQAVLEQDGPLRYESELLTQGARKSFYTAKFPLRDAAGRVEAIGAVTLDLTARRQAEERTRFQARLLEQVADAVVAIDGERRITYLNPAAVARYGLGESAEQLLGRPFLEMCTFRFPVAADQARAELAIGGTGVWRGELEHRRRDGVVFSVEATLCGLADERGQPGTMLGVFRDLAEQRRVEHALRESRQQLRALAARLQTVREEETGRIARDLHDELGQLLTGLKMDLRWVEGRIGQLPPGDGVNALLDRVVGASELADRTVTTVQRIAADLRPSTLDQLGLGAALGHEARRFQERTGVTCQVTGVEGLPPLPGEVSTALYRIAQEALTNVARHAAATRVAISLEVAAGVATLRVEDDGRGIGPVEPHALGLLGMKERATMLGGAVHVGRRAGSGTAVTARIPITRTTAAPEERS
jgi:PAS domain S-box-containing protein